MAVTRYVALLRGINVGGKNKVAMADLRAAFTDAGLADVSTYIASGNVLFSSMRPAAALEDDIEAFLEERLGMPLVVVVRSQRQRSRMSKIVGTPEYQLMTIRSWSTATRLRALLDGE
jgi:uncharacterized protein (DUF1697 family)